MWVYVLRTFVRKSMLDVYVVLLDYRLALPPLLHSVMRDKSPLPHCCYILRTYHCNSEWDTALLLPCLREQASTTRFWMISLEQLGCSTHYMLRSFVVSYTYIVHLTTYFLPWHDARKRNEWTHVIVKILLTHVHTYIITYASCCRGIKRPKSRWLTFFLFFSYSYKRTLPLGEQKDKEGERGKDKEKTEPKDISNFWSLKE